MGHKPPTLLSIFFFFTLFFVCLSLYIRSGNDSVLNVLNACSSSIATKYAVYEDHDVQHHKAKPHATTSSSFVSVLLLDWEALVLTPSDNSLALLDFRRSRDFYQCLFQENTTSSAKFYGLLPFMDQMAFICTLPERLRGLRRVLMPILTRQSDDDTKVSIQQREIMRWDYLVHDSFSTRDDVVVFAKGINGQFLTGNRPPTSLRCVFTNDIQHNAIRTAVTSSSSEVLRCLHPDITNFNAKHHIRISIEIKGKNETDSILVPSVAYYKSRHTLSIQDPKSKSMLCSTTMVYNMAKFLREWVIYHSKIGVEKFILYDNGSDDDLDEVVQGLVKDGYDILTIFWPWPKTQEAGFSHSAVFARNSCTWMLYMDVDEFVFSPAWLKSSTPSNRMLKSMLPSNTQQKVGQVMIFCHDFGPSNQTSHPVNGVIQGYTCRRRGETRHKSIVLLEAIDTSLFTVIHHFKLKEGYKSKKLSIREGVVNHYKYQAWSEFKAKFRRRASSNVVDWTDKANPNSQDRTPGLGFQAVEPEGWPQKFCAVNDHSLQWLTRRWFGHNVSLIQNDLANLNLVPKAYSSSATLGRRTMGPIASYCGGPPLLKN